MNAITPASIDSTAARLRALEARVARLERRPVPVTRCQPPADLAATLEQALASLGRAVARQST